MRWKDWRWTSEMGDEMFHHRQWEWMYVWCFFSSSVITKSPYISLLLVGKTVSRVLQVLCTISLGKTGISGCPGWPLLSRITLSLPWCSSYLETREWITAHCLRSTYWFLDTYMLRVTSKQQGGPAEDTSEMRESQEGQYGFSLVARNLRLWGKDALL